MKRREFLKASLAFAAASAAPALAGVKTYNQPVSGGLSPLSDVMTGARFYHKNGEFILAYFGTAHRKFKGCEGHLSNILAAAGEARSTYNMQLKPVLVFPPKEAGENTALFDTYVKSGAMQGLSASRETVKQVGESYKGFYAFDEQSGKVSFHKQAAMLIAPDGRLLSVFTGRNIDFYTMAKKAAENKNSAFAVPAPAH